MRIGQLINSLQNSPILSSNILIFNFIPLFAFILITHIVLYYDKILAEGNCLTNSENSLCVGTL